MNDVKAFCKTVSALQKAGLLSGQIQKVLCGQAKRGDLDGAMRGLRKALAKGEPRRRSKDSRCGCGAGGF